MAPVKANIGQTLETMKVSGLEHIKKRELLMSYLIKRNRYVSACEVYEFMNEAFKGVSYDAAYRNLYDFERLELLEKIELNGEQRFRFRCCQEVEHHHHFICTVCGKTEEIHMCPTNFFEEQLKGYSIEGHRSEILGRCADCCEKQRIRRKIKQKFRISSVGWLTVVYALAII